MVLAPAGTWMLAPIAVIFPPSTSNSWVAADFPVSGNTVTPALMATICADAECAPKRNRANVMLVKNRMDRFRMDGYLTLKWQYTLALHFLGSASQQRKRRSEEAKKRRSEAPDRRHPDKPGESPALQRQAKSRSLTAVRKKCDRVRDDTHSAAGGPLARS